MPRQSSLFTDDQAPAPVAVTPASTSEPKELLFRFGPAAFVELGVREDKARRVIGGWCKAGYHPTKILAAIKAAQDAKAIEPVSYARKVLGDSVGGGEAFLRGGQS